MFCLTHYKESHQSTKLIITSSSTPIFRKTPHHEHVNAIYFPLILPTGTVCPFVSGRSSKIDGALELTTLHLRLPEAASTGERHQNLPPTCILPPIKGKMQDSGTFCLFMFRQMHIQQTYQATYMPFAHNRFVYLKRDKNASG